MIFVQSFVLRNILVAVEHNATGTRNPHKYQYSVALHGHASSQRQREIYESMNLGFQILAHEYRDSYTNYSCSRINISTCTCTCPISLVSQRRWDSVSSTATATATSVTCTSTFSVRKGIRRDRSVKSTREA